MSGTHGPHLDTLNVLNGSLNEFLDTRKKCQFEIDVFEILEYVITFKVFYRNL